MYVDFDGSVEDICYEENHVQTVVGEIRKNFNKYFKGFIETLANERAGDSEVAVLKKNWGVPTDVKTSAENMTSNYKEIIVAAIEKFERDREDYIKIFDIDLLEEYKEEDADTFKSKVLRNECPIIRKTLANRKAKELDRYRAEFSKADPDLLLEVVYNLCRFGDEYSGCCDSDTYENATDYEELGMGLLDTDDYTAYGVIGGGIKTHMLYKIYPALFSNRSRSAVWALWYLTKKKTFECDTDSEFLMIDTKKNVTQQNYFYPYELFHFYAFEIYKLLRDKASDMNVYIDLDYRYVIVDAFLEYVADVHDKEISFLKSQIRDGGIGVD
jgi:hypothetical protein